MELYRQIHLWDYLVDDYIKKKKHRIDQIKTQTQISTYFECAL